MIYHFLASNDSKMKSNIWMLKHFFHTFPGIFCFLTNPCLVQMIRLLGAIFQGQLGCYFQGVGPPLNFFIHPRAGVGAPTITQGGVERFLGNHFLRRKVLEVNKKQLVFLGRSGKKRGKPLFFLMVGSFSFSQNDHDSFQLVGIL